MCVCMCVSVQICVTVHARFGGDQKSGQQGKEWGGGGKGKDVPSQESIVRGWGLAGEHGSLICCPLFCQFVFMRPWLGRK